MEKADCGNTTIIDEELVETINQLIGRLIDRELSSFFVIGQKRIAFSKTSP